MFLEESDPIYTPCWFAINGMWLNLLLIGALMCIIKYITMSQLENTGAIHHFNWYSPQTTWAHHIPSVISERSFFYVFIWMHSVTFLLSILCVHSGFVYFVCCGMVENDILASYYNPHISPDANTFCLLNGNVLWDANSSHPIHFVQAVTLNKP